ncbi:MAG: T9SS type A sorting domain-containing protein [Candidatus Azobacteroides sp.]|nr:T9SS type A sorting domain-containing protein [Candidatus Azobacteroides sp.]
MKKLITFLLMAWMCGSAMNAQTKQLYVDVSQAQGWMDANAALQAWVWGDGFDDQWSPVFTPVQDACGRSVYVTTIPSGATAFVLVRRDPSDVQPGGGNTWGIVWNQIPLSGGFLLNGDEGGNCLKVTGDPGSPSGSMTTYTSSASATPLDPITIRLCDPTVLEPCGNQGEEGIGTANVWTPETDDLTNSGDHNNVHFYYWYYDACGVKIDGCVKPDVVNKYGIWWYEYTFEDVIGSLNLVFLRKLDPAGGSCGFPTVWKGDQTMDIPRAGDPLITEDANFIIECMTFDGEGNRGVRPMTFEEEETIFNPTGLAQTTIGDYTVTSGSGMIRAQFEGTAAVELYTVSGVLLKKTAAVGSFEQTGLAPGLYIVKINGEASKVAVK